MFFKVVYPMFFKVVYPMFFEVVYPMFFTVVYPMFFKVVYSMFFHASYVVQEVLLLMFLFLITKKLLFPVHPFQLQQLWDRYKTQQLRKVEMRQRSAM